MPPCYLNPVHIRLPKWGTYSIYIYIYMAVIKCILSLYLCIDKDMRNISSGLCSKCEAFASHLLQSSEDIVHMRRKFLAHTWQVPTPRWCSYQHRLKLIFCICIIIMISTSTKVKFLQYFMLIYYIYNTVCSTLNYSSAVC